MRCLLVCHMCLQSCAAPADVTFVNWLLTSDREPESVSNFSSPSMVEPRGSAKVQSGSGRKKRRRKVSRGDCAKGQPSLPPAPAKALEHEPPVVQDASPDPPSVDTQPNAQDILKEVDTASPLVADSSQVPRGWTQDQRQVKENRTSKDLQSSFSVTDDGAKVKVAWKTVARLVSPSVSVSSLELFAHHHFSYTLAHTQVWTFRRYSTSRRHLR